MNIILLTSFFQSLVEDEILLNSKGKQIAVANSTFQKALLSGFSKQLEEDKYYIDNITCINQPNIGAFPFNYSKIYYKGLADISKGEIIIKEPSFINIAYLKHNSKYRGIKTILLETLQNVMTKNNVIICYDLYGPWLKALKRLKQKFNFKVVNIVPDLPSMTGTPDSILYRIYNKLPHYDLNKTLDVVDGFIFLAEKMGETLNQQNKPQIVVEGIYQPEEKEIKELLVQGEKNEDGNSFTIMYSGALSRRNGVKDLINAVKEIQDQKLRLKLFGGGELVDEIISITDTDHRIEYMGQISHEKMLAQLCHADLLVNPRMPQQDFTLYSFPSKTMEYMASGKPVLMYHLPTLPEEYDQYLYLLEDTSVGALAAEIERIMLIPKEIRLNKGMAAKKFILEKKNPIVQTDAIVEFIKNQII